MIILAGFKIPKFIHSAYTDLGYYIKRELENSDVDI